MNKVLENENKERNIQIYRGSKKMFQEAKIAKIIMYIINFIPLILVFTQDMFVDNEDISGLVKFTSSAVSIILNIMTELISNIIANHKENAVLLAQLFETEITKNTLSKIEYDRETTNELYELAIRKGTLKKEKRYKGAYDVPQEIEDKYAFLFINRYIAAENRFLLDKLQIFYGVLITAVSIAFIFWLSNMSMAQAVYYIVCFWSVFIPIIRNFSKCSKNKKQCVKLSADIDNFFADGDDSKERLQRFNFYVQSLSFEMRNNLVIIPTTLRWLFSFQIKVLDVGVTNRFIEAIYEFESLASEKKGNKAIKRKFEWISRDDKDPLVETKKEKEIIRRAKQSTAQSRAVQNKEKKTKDNLEIISPKSTKSVAKPTESSKSQPVKKEVSKPKETESKPKASVSSSPKSAKTPVSSKKNSKK